MKSRLFAPTLGVILSAVTDFSAFSQVINDSKHHTNTQFYAVLSDFLRGDQSITRILDKDDSINLPTTNLYRSTSGTEITSKFSYAQDESLNAESLKIESPEGRSTVCSRSTSSNKNTLNTIPAEKNVRKLAFVCEGLDISAREQQMLQNISKLLSPLFDDVQQAPISNDKAHWIPLNLK